MRLSDDSGLSLAELIVVVALMGFVLAAVYLGLEFSYRAQSVADIQGQFAREISAPLRVMDASFSQSTIPPFGTAYEPYHVRLRLPVDYKPGTILEHDYLATTDGRIVQTVYKVVGTTRTVLSQTTWSRTNANQAMGVPLFTYYEGSSVSSSVVGADAVVIEVCSRYEGDTYRDKRRVAFRNR